jgi:hypothetical protein
MLPDFVALAARNYPRKIYVASSWKNEHQPKIVVDLRQWGHEVYDFRNPLPNNTGFNWRDVDPDWEKWDVNGWRHGLEHPLSKEGHRLDQDALDWADTTIFVFPAGMSASWELGYATASGQDIFAYAPTGEIRSPELMFREAVILADEGEFQAVFAPLNPTLLLPQ